MYKTSKKHLKIHKFPFKNVIVLAIECKMYLKIQQKVRWLGCISKQTMGSAVKKTRLNSSKDDFLMKSFPFSTKRKLSILLNFLFPFLVFQRCIFNPEMQNSCLKTSALWSRSSHFVENGYLSSRFPNMVKLNIHEHWTRVTRFNPLGFCANLTLNELLWIAPLSGGDIGTRGGGAAVNKQTNQQTLELKDWKARFH